MAGIGDYFRAAIAHPWNLMMLGAGAAASVITGSEVPVMLAAGAELAYLGIVPANERFRRAVDARLARRRRKHAKRRDRERLAELAPNQRDQYQALRAIADRIEHQHARAGDLAGLGQRILERVEGLLASFLDLQILLHDVRRNLNDASRKALERDLSAVEADLAKPGSDAVLEVKRQRAAILRSRLSQFQRGEEIRELVSHQLASIEDMLRLVHEQSITMRDPSGVSQQLEVLAAQVEETEASARHLRELLTASSPDSLVPPPPVRVR